MIADPEPATRGPYSRSPVHAILQNDIDRRAELVRISQKAIELHRDRIAGHEAIIDEESAEIRRLQRAITNGAGGPSRPQED